MEDVADAEEEGEQKKRMMYNVAEYAHEDGEQVRYVV